MTEKKTRKPRQKKVVEVVDEEHKEVPNGEPEPEKVEKVEKVVEKKVEKKVQEVRCPKNGRLVKSF